MPLGHAPVRLVSAVMASREELEAERKRRGYWIRRARELHGLTQHAVAEALGYSGKSLSTVSLWESGLRPVPSDKIGPLSRLVKLPPDWIVNPPLTDEERLSAAVLAAEELEREDAEPEEPPALRAVGARAGGPRRRSA